MREAPVLRNLLAETTHGRDKPLEATASTPAIQAIIDAIPSYVMIVDNNHSILLANKKIKEDLGLNDDQIVGAYCPKAIHGLDQPYNGCPLEDAIRQDRAVIKELYDPNTNRWVNSAVYPTTLETGDRQTVFLHIVHDITEQKKSEEQITKLSLAVEQSPTCIAISDVDGNIEYVNPKFSKLSGYSCEEAVGINLRAVQIGEHNLGDYKAIWSEIALGNRWNGGLICRKNEMDCRWVDLSVSPIKDNEAISHYLWVFRDVSKQKQADEAVRASEKRLRDITSALGEGVYVLNRDGRLIFMNPEAERILKWTEVELLDENIHDIIHHQKADGTHLRSRDCPALKVIDAGETYRIEDDVFTRKDGTMLPVAYVSTPIIEDGDVVASVTAFRDITKQKQADEELRQSLERLQKTFEGIVRALSSMGEKRDPYTAGHQQRVAKIACAIAKEMGLDEERIEGIRVAAILHDIGKMSIPAEILTKPGRLNEIEFTMMKTHSQIGYEILKTIEFPWPVAKIVLQHHERLNGSGYPLGISAADILDEAKILAVADVVEAMASHRPYRPALGVNKALEELSSNKGICYDPEVVDVCIKLFSNNAFTALIIDAEKIA